MPDYPEPGPLERLHLAGLVLWDGILDVLAPYLTPTLDKLSAYLKETDHNGH